MSTLARLACVRWPHGTPPVCGGRTARPRVSYGILSSAEKLLYSLFRRAAK